MHYLKITSVTSVLLFQTYLISVHQHEPLESPPSYTQDIPSQDQITRVKADHTQHQEPLVYLEHDTHNYIVLIVLVTL